MARYPRVLLCLFLILHVLYAQNHVIENSARLIEPAIVDITVEIRATLTIEKEILSEFREIVGRSYTFSGNSSMYGAVISADGYILSNSRITDNATVVNNTLRYAAPLIAGDTGKIDHLKKYGQRVQEDELASYKEYFFGLYTGSNGFNAKLFDEYMNGAISVRIERKEIYVRLSQDSKPLRAQLIDGNDGITLLKIEKNNMPTIELRNTTLRNGDEVFVIDPVNNKTEQNFIQNNNDGYGLVRQNNGNGDSVSVITDDAGNPVALQLSDSIIPSADVTDLLQKNGIVETPSQTNTEFGDALYSYDTGDYQKSKEKLESILSIYPEHEQAKRYLKNIGEKINGNKNLFDGWIGRILEFGKKILSKLPGEAGIIVLILIVMALSLYAITKLKTGKKGQKRRNN